MVSKEMKYVTLDTTSIESQVRMCHNLPIASDLPCGTSTTCNTETVLRSTKYLAHTGYEYRESQKSGKSRVPYRARLDKYTMKFDRVALHTYPCEREPGIISTMVSSLRAFRYKYYMPLREPYHAYQLRSCPKRLLEEIRSDSDQCTKRCRLVLQSTQRLACFRKLRELEGLLYHCEELERATSCDTMKIVSMSSSSITFTNIKKQESLKPGSQRSAWRRKTFTRRVAAFTNFGENRGECGKFICPSNLSQLKHFSMYRLQAEKIEDGQFNPSNGGRRSHPERTNLRIIPKIKSRKEDICKSHLPTFIATWSSPFNVTDFFRLFWRMPLGQSQQLCSSKRAGTTHEIYSYPLAFESISSANYRMPTRLLSLTIGFSASLRVPSAVNHHSEPFVVHKSRFSPRRLYWQSAVTEGLSPNGNSKGGLRSDFPSEPEVQIKPTLSAVAKQYKKAELRNLVYSTSGTSSENFQPKPKNIITSEVYHSVMGCFWLHQQTSLKNSKHREHRLKAFALLSNTWQLSLESCLRIFKSLPFAFSFATPYPSNSNLPSSISISATSGIEKEWNEHVCIACKEHETSFACIDESAIHSNAGSPPTTSLSFSHESSPHKVFSIPKIDSIPSSLADGKRLDDSNNLIAHYVETRRSTNSCLEGAELRSFSVDGQSHRLLENAYVTSRRAMRFCNFGLEDENVLAKREFDRLEPVLEASGLPSSLTNYDMGLNGESPASNLSCYFEVSENELSASYIELQTDTEFLLLDGATMDGSMRQPIELYREPAREYNWDETPNLPLFSWSAGDTSPSDGSWELCIAPKHTYDTTSALNNSHENDQKGIDYIGTIDGESSEDRCVTGLNDTEYSEYSALTSESGSICASLSNPLKSTESDCPLIEPTEPYCIKASDQHGNDVENYVAANYCDLHNITNRSLVSAATGEMTANAYDTPTISASQTDSTALYDSRNIYAGMTKDFAGYRNEDSYNFQNNHAVHSDLSVIPEKTMKAPRLGGSDEAFISTGVSNDCNYIRGDFLNTDLTTPTMRVSHDDLEESGYFSEEPKNVFRLSKRVRGRLSQIRPIFPPPRAVYTDRDPLEVSERVRCLTETKENTSRKRKLVSSHVEKGNTIRLSRNSVNKIYLETPTPKRRLLGAFNGNHGVRQRTLSEGRTSSARNSGQTDISSIYDYVGCELQCDSGQENCLSTLDSIRNYEPVKISNFSVADLLKYQPSTKEPYELEFLNPEPPKTICKSKTVHRLPVNLTNICFCFLPPNLKPISTELPLNKEWVYEFRAAVQNVASWLRGYHNYVIIEDALGRIWLQEEFEHIIIPLGGRKIIIDMDIMDCNSWFLDILRQVRAEELTSSNDFPYIISALAKYNGISPKKVKPCMIPDDLKAAQLSANGCRLKAVNPWMAFRSWFATSLKPYGLPQKDISGIARLVWSAIGCLKCWDNIAEEYTVLRDKGEKNLELATFVEEALKKGDAYFNPVSLVHSINVELSPEAARKDDNSWTVSPKDIRKLPESLRSRMIDHVRFLFGIPTKGQLETVSVTALEEPPVLKSNWGESSTAFYPISMLRRMRAAPI